MDNYIAAAALAFGLIVVGLTSWIEHRRKNNPMPHLMPTTPFMLFGAIVVLVVIAFSLTRLFSTPATNFEARARKAPLTSSETAKFKAHLSTCWVTPIRIPSAEGLLLLRILLDKDGNLRDKPNLIWAPASQSGPVLVESAMRALQLCQPYNFLPATKYEQWRVLDVSFSPQGPSEVLTANERPQ